MSKITCLQQFMLSFWFLFNFLMHIQGLWIQICFLLTIWWWPHLTLFICFNWSRKTLNSLLLFFWVAIVIIEVFLSILTDGPTREFSLHLANTNYNLISCVQPNISIRLSLNWLPNHGLSHYQSLTLSNKCLTYLSITLSRARNFLRCNKGHRIVWLKLSQSQRSAVNWKNQEKHWLLSKNIVKSSILSLTSYWLKR